MSCALSFGERRRIKESNELTPFSYFPRTVKQSCSSFLRFTSCRLAFCLQTSLRRSRSPTSARQLLTISSTFNSSPHLPQPPRSTHPLYSNC